MEKNLINALLAIELENFFSIKNKIRLDFRAGNIHTAAAKMLSDNIFEWNGQKILKTVGLFGPNAAGKSNIMKAINFCCRMILDSHAHNQGVVFNFKPFKFDGWDQKPSSFYIDFVCENIEYEYSFKLTTTEILEEALYYYPNNRKAKIFERKGSKYTFGTKGINRPAEVANDTSSTQLYLSVASQKGRNIAKSVYLYFLQTFLLGLVQMQDASIENLFKQEKKIIMKALEVCDSDICDIAVEHKKGFAPVPTPSLDGQQIGFQMQPIDIMRFHTYHRNNPNIPFDFETEESNGTKRIFTILIRLLDVARNKKSMMIDEFDTSMHPHLAQFVIDLVHASESSQLLFTSHNAALIDMDRFRKDQIYFINKKVDGSTDAYSLYDFKDFRETMDATKGYLQGRFDAVPIITSSVATLKQLLKGGIK